MKQINYNAQTGETIIADVADIEHPVIEPEPQSPTPEERLTLLENAILSLMLE